MEKYQVSQPEKQRGVAAVKESCRFFSTAFLSLLPPLWLILFARISAARHHSSAQNHQGTQKNVFIISSFLHTKATLIVGILVFASAIAATIHVFVGDKRTWLIIRVRRRLECAVVLLFSVQVCLSLWIHGVMEGDRIGSDCFGSLTLFRSLVLALGLHGMVVLWRRRVVKPVVDEVIMGFSEDGCSWVEKVVLAAAFGCVWWRRLRRDVEEIMVLRRDHVEVLDIVGWLLCGLMAAVGGATVIKRLLWVINKIFRHHSPANNKVNAVDNNFGLKFDIEIAV